MLIRQLLLTFLMTVSLLQSFSSDSKAQDIPDNEGVNGIDNTTDTTKTGPKRVTATFPICANYNVLSFC